MKYIITNKDNVIQVIANEVETKADRYLLVEERLEIFKDYATQDMEGNITHDYQTLYQVELPENVVEQKYCYTENDGFYANPNYVEPPKPIEERVSSAEDSITEIELALTEIYEGGLV